MSTTTIDYPATAKQVAFLRDLATSRQWDDGHDYSDVLTDAAAGHDVVGIDKRIASDLISELLATPRRQARAAAATQAAQPGYYLREDTVFVVVWNREHTRTYAKRMVVSNGHGSWRYAAGAGRDIAAEGLVPLTIADAARLGHLHGCCIVCGKRLTHPESVARGIGPVCAKRIAESHIALTAPTAAPTPAPAVQTRPNRYAAITDLNVLDMEVDCDLSGEIVWADGENTPEQAAAYTADVQADAAERRTQIIAGR